MTISIALPYGTQRIAFHLESHPEVLQVHEPTALIDETLFRSRLRRFLETVELDLARPAVVVADRTRLCGYPRYLPVLLDALTAAGAAMHRLKIFIAYGTHGRQSRAQSQKAYGAVYDQPVWVHHQCDDPSLFVELGATRRGTPVRLRRDIMDAGGLITFGAITHHYFAGFGGGRKLVFPGLGERGAIHSNHGLFLDRARRCLAAGCRSGRLDGNPLAEDLAEVETFRPADLAVHAILNSRGQVCDLLVGRGVDHFHAACAAAGDGCRVSGGPYDLVLAACGGFPKDINFIQSHKAIHHAAAFVRDGGRLIVLAQCADGVGSDTFLPWFALGGWDAAFDRLSERYVGNGGTALAMMEKLRRIRIGVMTDLDPLAAERIGFDRLSEDQARREVLAHRGSLAVIPNASLVMRCEQHG